MRMNLVVLSSSRAKKRAPDPQFVSLKRTLTGCAWGDGKAIANDRIKESNYLPHTSEKSP
jgi:hypothetical protein